MKTQTNPRGANQLPRNSRTIAHTHKVELISPWLRCFFLTLFTMYRVCVCVGVVLDAACQNTTQANASNHTMKAHQDT